jgi:hypothetical protein
MRKRRKSLLSSIALMGGVFVIVAFLLALKAPAGNKEYVIVKTYESVGKKGEIVLAYGSGKSERIAMEQLNSQHHEHNANKLVDVFNRLDTEGYVFEGMGAAGSGNPASLLQVDAYVFSRQKN